MLPCSRTSLVSNAIQPARTEVLVELIMIGGAILIVVSDGSTRQTRVRALSPLDEAGRGLVLVDALSTRWVAVAWLTGKQVWADLHATAR
jgi:hypothetical protein